MSHRIQLHSLNYVPPELWLSAVREIFADISRTQQ